MLVDGEMSNGSCWVLMDYTPPGDGPPPPSHTEDDIFTVLEGDYEVFREGQWTKAPSMKRSLAPPARSTPSEIEALLAA